MQVYIYYGWMQSLYAAVLMPPFPHEKLPEVQLSLHDFNQKARTILNERAVEEFVSAVLAGRWRNAVVAHNGEESEEQEYRATIDPFLHCYQGNDLGDNITVTRDFDSLIGITRNLPLTCPLAMYPVPNFRDSLTRTNHLTRMIRYQVRTPQNCKNTIITLR
jgi:hypothetical protein